MMEAPRVIGDQLHSKSGVAVAVDHHGKHTAGRFGAALQRPEVQGEKFKKISTFCPYGYSPFFLH